MSGPNYMWSMSFPRSTIRSRGPCLLGSSLELCPATIPHPSPFWGFSLGRPGWLDSQPFETRVKFLGLSRTLVYWAYRADIPAESQYNGRALYWNCNMRNGNIQLPDVSLSHAMLSFLAIIAHHVIAIAVHEPVLPFNLQPPMSNYCLQNAVSLTDIGSSWCCCTVLMSLGSSTVSNDCFSLVSSRHPTPYKSGHSLAFPP